MAKQILILPKIFLTDIITNSSSEIFICGPDKELEAVEEIVATIYEMAGKDFRHELFISKMSYDEFTTLAYYKYDHLLPDYSDFRLKDGKYNWSAHSRETAKVIDTLWDEYDNKDGVIIKSINDNSISYEFFDVLCALLNATRYHLG